MSLLDFIQQHDRIGTTPDGFGQNSAFAIADISRRRAFQSGDGMRFLEFRHVDGDQVVFAAVEQVGKRQRGFGFPDAAGAHQHEDAKRLARIVEAGAAGLNTLADQSERVTLTDDAAPRCLSSSRTIPISSLIILPRGMPVQPEITWPTIWRVDANLHQRGFALYLIEFFRQLGQLCAELGSVFSNGNGGEPAAWAAAAVPFGSCGSGSSAVVPFEAARACRRRAIRAGCEYRESAQPDPSSYPTCLPDWARFSEAIRFCASSSSILSL